MAGHMQYPGGPPMGWPGQPQLYPQPQHYQPQPQPLPGFWPSPLQQPPLTPQPMYTTAVPPSPWHPGPQMASQMAYMQQPPQNPWQMPTQPMAYQTSYGWNQQPAMGTPYADYSAMYSSQEAPAPENPERGPSLVATPEQVADLARELGVDPATEEDLSWIAEYGLQSDALPPGWSSQVDDESGKIYYINEDSQESVWESPLKPHLQHVVDTGRAYLARPRAGFWEEARLNLLEVRQQEMDAWTGPYVDDSGRHYYANPETGESQWKDPRESAQFCLELVANLLVSLSQVLPGPEELEVAPTFGSSGEPAPAAPAAAASPGQKVLTESGAEVLTLEASPGNLSTGSPSDYSPSSSPIRARSSWMRSLAMESSANERASTLQSMGRALLWLSEASQAEELAQRRQLKRRVELRRLRKLRSSQHALASASKTRSEEARMMREDSKGGIDSASLAPYLREEEATQGSLSNSNAINDESKINDSNSNSNSNAIGQDGNINNSPQHSEIMQAIDCSSSSSSKKNNSPNDADSEIMQAIDCSSSSKNSSPNDGASATGSTLYGASSCAGSNYTSATAEANPLRGISLDAPIAPCCGPPDEYIALGGAAGKLEEHQTSQSPLPPLSSAPPTGLLTAPLPEAPLQLQSAGPSPQHNSSSCSSGGSPNRGPGGQVGAGAGAAPLAAAALLLSEEVGSPPNASSPAPVTFAFAPAPAPALASSIAAGNTSGDPEAVVSIAPGLARAVTFEDVT